MSYSDISNNLSETYVLDISDSVINSVTDRIIAEIKEWQGRSFWILKLYGGKISNSNKIMG